MSAKEGLYATLYMTGGTAQPPAVVALLTGVELSWSQTTRRFYPMGSLQPSQILRGVIAWEGRFRKAYVDNAFIGSFNTGTYLFAGSITPRGANSPAILGTVVLTGGNLSNMEMENEAPVLEEQSFIMYGLSTVG